MVLRLPRRPQPESLESELEWESELLESFFFFFFFFFSFFRNFLYSLRQGFFELGKQSRSSSMHARQASLIGG